MEYNKAAARSRLAIAANRCTSSLKCIYTSSTYAIDESKLTTMLADYSAQMRECFVAAGLPPLLDLLSLSFFELKGQAGEDGGGNACKKLVSQLKIEAPVEAEMEMAKTNSSREASDLINPPEFDGPPLFAPND
ncbi:hypothetical protein Efla_007132 [Eimeria flavescens]